MDTAQWPQGIGVVKSGVPEKKPRPQKEQAVNCPRCNSTNTKFCYYNNYSLSQPRYFCKTCRRYWTDGGSLWNVPVGGGSRKNRRSSSSSSSSSSSASKKLFSDPTPQNPNKIHEGQDLNLAYNPCNGVSEFVALPYCNNPPTLNPSPHLPVMELFKTGGFSSLMSDSNSVYSAGFSAMTEFKPSLGFGLDNYGSINQDHANPSRVSFPFEELKVPVSNNGDDHHHQFVEERETGETNGYWNGMLSGGTW